MRVGSFSVTPYFMVMCVGVSVDVHVRVHALVCCIYVGMVMHVWRSEANTGRLPLLLSTRSLEIWSATDPGTHQFAWGWLANGL